MRFSKTNNTLTELRKYSADSIQIGDILAVINDILEDTMMETEKKFSELCIDKTAVQRWMAICRAFLGVPVSEAAGELSARQKERMVKLQSELSEKNEVMSKISEELQFLESNINSFISQLDELKKEFLKKKEMEEKAHSKQAEIEQLRKKIENCPTVDIQALEREKGELKQKLRDIEQEIILSYEKMNDLDIQIKGKKEELTITQSRQEEAEQALDELNKRIDVTTRAVNEAAFKKEKAEDEYKKLETEVQMFEEISEKLVVNHSSLQMDYAVQKNKVGFLDGKIQEIQEKIVLIEEEKLEKQQELNTKKEEYNAIVGTIDNLNIRLEEKNMEINKADEEIKRLGEREQQIIRQINDKRRSLEETQPQQLEEQLADLDKQLELQRNENEKLNDEKGRKQMELEMMEADISTLNAGIRTIEEQLTLARQEKQDFEKKMNEHKTHLGNLMADIEEYKKLFSSTRYEEEVRRIESYKEVVRVYQEGVRVLFEKDIPSVYLNKEGELLLQNSKDKLQTQLNSIESIFNELSTEYISVITQIERKANQYEV